MITERDVFIKIAELAHQQNETLESLLNHIDQTYSIKEDSVPRNEEGELLYSNGDVGIPITPTEEEFVLLNLAASKKGMTLNDFMREAVDTKIKEMGLA